MAIHLGMENCNMYNIMQETMVEGTLLRAVTGSIFEAENNAADGVAIFVMCGLTGFRPNARDYVRTLGDSIGRYNGLAIFSRRTERGDILFLYDENPDNKIYTLDEMHDLVNKAFKLFAKKGIRRIAMNGIRITPEDKQEHLAEMLLVAFVKSWCSAHEGAFEVIDFVGKDGGFDKIGFLATDWPLSAEVQYKLGMVYEVGIDVGKDLVEAMKWYRNAAENGNAEAQYKLGHYYRSGVGIEKNYVEAVAWYRKAAEQGHSHAQERLARCYVRGAGVERNLEEAEKLLKKAVASAKGKTEKACLQARYDSFVEMVLNGDDDSAYLWYRGQCSRE